MTLAGKGIIVDPESVQSGQRVGNFVLDERIGAGAFSEVWRAHHHEQVGRIVAVKLATDREYARLLRREVRLPEIHHPNVVPVLDADTRADVPYLVIEYVEGSTLRDLINQHPQGVPLDRVRSILGDILEGLSVAHDAKIIHRDIKPENVLIERQTGRARITDFGLRELTGENATGSILQSLSVDQAEHRHLAGTLAYMSPEQREGADVDARADVWAVGVMLFEMLIGSRSAGPELPSRRRPEAGRLWDSVYSQARAPLQERFRDARALAAAIRTDEDPLQSAGARDIIVNFLDLYQGKRGRAEWSDLLRALDSSGYPIIDEGAIQRLLEAVAVQWNAGEIGCKAAAGLA